MSAALLGASSIPSTTSPTGPTERYQNRIIDRVRYIFAAALPAFGAGDMIVARRVAAMVTTEKVTTFLIVCPPVRARLQYIRVAGAARLRAG